MMWSYEKDEGNDKVEKCAARYAAPLAMHVRYIFLPSTIVPPAHSSIIPDGLCSLSESLWRSSFA